MKKLITIFLYCYIFIINVFAQKLSFEYQLNEDTQSYDFFLQKKGKYIKNSIVSIYDVLEQTEDEFSYIYFGITPDQEYIPLKSLRNPNVTCDFSQFYAGVSRSSFLVPDYVITALSKKNRDYIMKFDKNTSRLNIQDGEWTFTWYMSGMGSQCISESIFALGTAYSQDLFFVKKSQIKNENKLEVNAVIKKYDDSRVITDIFSDLNHGQNVSLSLEKDGDYLKLYIGNEEKPRQVYCYVDFDTMNEINTFIEYDYCNYTKVTWPRHADGSSDYDNEIKPPVVQLSDDSSFVADQENEEIINTITPAHTMSVTENLKLRSGEATTTEVLTVMAAGTKVKILELGHSETIDGITSNWVKVELLAGAIDRDGKPIKAGMVGWCYGGYLKLIEEPKADKPSNKKDEKKKKKK